MFINVYTSHGPLDVCDGEEEELNGMSCIHSLVMLQADNFYLCMIIVGSCGKESIIYLLLAVPMHI